MGEEPLNNTDKGKLPHIVWLGTGLTVGAGLMAMLNVWGGPGQTPMEGVTVMMAVWAALVGVWPEKEILEPVPEAGNPILELLFVQL